MKIVFFGTSAFGLPSLEAIQGSHHTISLVVTTPDKPKGRNLQLTPTPVKEWAVSHGLKVLEASKENILSFEEVLKKEAADVFVVISFGVILPKAIFSIPSVAPLNIHSSLLPRYRGPAPIHWAILNGDARTGVTVMRIAESMDTGDLLLQESTPIDDDEDEPALHARLADMGARLLLRGLVFLEEKKDFFEPQDEKLATYARKITKEDGRILWNLPAARIHNQVRALAGWPGAFTFFKDKRIIIRKASVADGKSAPEESGRILAASAQEGLLVAAGGEVLCIEELQMEGRNRLASAAFLAGFPLKAGDVLE